MVNPDPEFTSHNTDHNTTPTTRKTNEEKIYDYIKSKNKELTTTDISEALNIDIRNITRYLKALEKKGKITRETRQEGRKRFVIITLKSHSMTRNNKEVDITTHTLPIKPRKQSQKASNPIFSRKKDVEFDTDLTSLPITSHNKPITSHTSFSIPDFNDLIQFCLDHYKNEAGEVIDIELEQFLKHTLPRTLHREEFGFERGGGGWSAATKCTLVVINKLLKSKKEVKKIENN